MYQRNGTQGGNQSSLVPQLFNYEGASVRVVMVDGNPWWVGKDVADVLGYVNSSKAIINHVDDEDKTMVMLPQSQNGNLVTQTALINESGLYSLIFGSKLSSAKEFKRWVTSVVLPSIRKTGSYSVTPRVPKTFKEALLLAVEQQE